MVIQIQIQIQPHTSTPHPYPMSDADVLVDGRYRLLTRVGRGATGEVYRAIDVTKDVTTGLNQNQDSNAHVAVKLVDLEDAEDEVADIQREIGILAQCASPYVTKYLGSALLRGTSKLAIVMEYMAGGSARHLVEEIEHSGDSSSKGLGEGEISFITRDVLRALEYLHAEGKIHRDVKAANVLLTASAEARLADFGVSGQMTHTLGARRKTFTGTPFWMAPEVIQGGEGYDEKADIWSLGITCYELATGSAPHSDLHPMRVLFVIPKEDPPSLPPDGDFSDDFRDFVSQCLRKDPLERPSAEELLKHPFVARFDVAAIQTLQARVDKHIALTDDEEGAHDSASALAQKEANTSSSAPAWDFGDDSLGRKFTPPEAAVVLAAANAEVRSEHGGSAPSVYQSMGGTIRMAEPPSLSDRHTEDGVSDDLVSMDAATFGTTSSHSAHQRDKLDALLENTLHTPLMRSLIGPALETIQTRDDEDAHAALQRAIEALDELEIVVPGSLMTLVQSIVRELARSDDESLRTLKSRARSYFGATRGDSVNGLSTGGRSVVANYLIARWQRDVRSDL